MNTEDTQQQDTTLSTGERLRRARELLGLSQTAVATRLCLKVSTVRDIEENNISEDLASTFIRGYIRSYAKLVHLPEDSLLTSTTADQTSLKQQKVASMQRIRNIRHRKKHDGWLVALTWLIVVIVIGLSCAWWWQNHKAQQSSLLALPQPVTMATGTRYNTETVPASAPKAVANPVPSASVSANRNSQDSNAVNSVLSTPSLNTAPLAARPLVTEPKPAPLNLPVEPPAVQVPPPPISSSRKASQQPAPVSANELSMHFTGDCWIEVSDGSGKTLFSGLKRKNDRLVFNSQPPYQLKIGAPDAVQIRYGGKPVDPGHAPTNRVMRLTLNATH